MRKSFFIRIITYAIWRQLRVAVVFLVLCQSCHFGGGLVEENLIDDFSLFANNALAEMTVWYYPGEHKSHLIIGETVFAVGYNADFIIAKVHPNNNRDLTVYHLIDIKVCKENPKESRGLTLEQFELARTQLRVPDALDFTIVYNELD